MSTHDDMMAAPRTNGAARVQEQSTMAAPARAAEPETDADAGTAAPMSAGRMLAHAVMVPLGLGLGMLLGAVIALGSGLIGLC